MFIFRALAACLLLNIGLGEDFPMCGDCWCSTDNNGTSPCPSWSPQSDFSNATVSVYLTQKPSSIYSLSCNPYVNSSCSTVPAQILLDVDTAVCAYIYPNIDGSVDQQSCSVYSMETFESIEAAEAAGGVVTHMGPCGLCSTTQDLAIYLTEDFTTAGKICATKGLFNEAAGLSCYMEIGLTEECAKIWNYDGIYDGQVCGSICAKELTEPNNGPAPECTLNDCLQCDEDLAGPLFSTFAGRTRRRSGLLSEIIRPCSSIAQIAHTPCDNPVCGC